jgi:hypothetical protein
MYPPAVARESTQMITPCWYLKPRVVVPCSIRIRHSNPCPLLKHVTIVSIIQKDQ